MGNNKTKIFVWVVFVTAIVIILGIAFYKTQSKPTVHSPTHIPRVLPTASKIPPTPTDSPLSAAALENFFGDSSCSWPCWQGVIPSATTSNEALQKLHNSPLVYKKSLQVEEFKMGVGSASWSWQLEGTQSGIGKIEWRDGMAFEVILDTYSYHHEIPLEEVVNRFGPPEKFSFMNCTEVIEGPQSWCGTLHYAKIGFEVHLEWADTEPEDLLITPADPVTFVALFKPSSIKDHLESLFGVGILEGINLQDWKGYGKLFELYVQDP
jgi:hypothetical protein